ncbi:MAG: sulfotransferase family protein [Ponticaulis sp.]|nr:sulfotransferase family protein [Ponticaulis sp.]
MRIAMWSGPRNLSTAMMRSFGARADTVCTDEPFYAAYLETTGLDHPMRNEILDRHLLNPKRIAHDMAYKACSKPIFYQKHMTHHMISSFPRDWMSKVRNAFLIRHPARVLASYSKKAEAVSLSDIGFVQQGDLFEYVWEMNGAPPVVVDSDDVLRKPKATLKKLCKRLDIPFTEDMLSWSEGPKPEDGAWAPHWYDGVNASTGFGSPPGELPAVSPAHSGILEAARPIYDYLAEHKI